MNKINVGILGCANIAKKFVIQGFIDSKNFNIVGIASRNIEKAIDFGSVFDINAFGSYEELLECSNIDAVYIPLPNSLHYTWIKKALERRIHVLVEKSLSCSYADTLELNNIARNNNLVLVENFQFRFHRQMKFIEELLQNSYVGSVRNIISSFGFPPFPNSSNIRYSKMLGGGALLDAGAYPVKITQIILGDNLHVSTASLHIPESSEVDIWGSASINDKSNNVVSQISFGFDHFYQNRLEIWGNKGKISTNRIFTAGPGIRTLINLENEQGKKTIELEPDNHFINMINHFFDLISGTASRDDEYMQNLNQAALINQIQQKSLE